MKGTYQFEDYMASARESLEEGNTDTAMDWVQRALSLSKYLEDEQLAKAYRLKTRILMAEEEFSEAEEVLEKSLDMFGRNVEGHVLLGELMLLDGRHEEATSVYEWVVEAAPQNVHALSLLIFCHGLSGKYDAAKECFDRCVEVDPEMAESYYHMGICLLREGKPEAAELFRNALSKDPVLSGPHYYLARMSIVAGDFQAAQRELQRELELNPANSMAELQLIRSYLMSLPWEEAVDVFDRHFPEEVFPDIPAVKSCRFHCNFDVFDERFSPFVQALMDELRQTPENIFRVARIHRYKSLFGEAIEFLKETTEADKNFRPAYAELADIYRIQGDLARSCEVLEQAAAIFQDAGAYCDLGRTFASCGRYSDAEGAARKAVSLSPDLAEPHYLLGAILAGQAARTKNSEELTEEAKKSLLRALQLDPHHAAARTYLMHISFQSGRFEECLGLAGQVLRENAEDRDALWYSGRCYHEMGNLPPAEERLLKLLELHLDDQDGRQALAEIYRAQSKFKEAAEELEQVIAVPGRRPPLESLLRLGEIYLLDLNEPMKAREYLVRFLQAAPPGHPDFDRAKELLGNIKP